MLVGASIQSKALSQTSSAERRDAPDSEISSSLPTTFSTRTVLPDFEGPDKETTWPGGIQRVSEDILQLFSFALNICVLGIRAGDKDFSRL